MKPSASCTTGGASTGSMASPALEPKAQSATAPPMRQTGTATVKPGPRPEEPDGRLWREAMRDLTAVEVKIVSGERFTGHVRRFGFYSICIDPGDGEVLILKNALCWARRRA